MPQSVSSIIKAISSTNNCYRDRASPIASKLKALWEMGDILVHLKVTRPHSVGWAIQKETRGLIKRPTIFRCHKIRTIWPIESEFIRTFKTLKRLSHLTEILPLVDPAQKVRQKLSREEIEDLYRHACADEPSKFKIYLKLIKTRFSQGKLGKQLDRSKHLKELLDIRRTFDLLRRDLFRLIEDETSANRDKLRARISEHEFRAFSNMCIALTTKENFRLYKRLPPAKKEDSKSEFSILFSYFCQILSKETDIERARLRRLISAEALAEMSDVVSSLSREIGVEDFRERRKMSISL